MRARNVKSSRPEQELLTALRRVGLRPQTQVDVWSRDLPGKHGKGHTVIDYAWSRLKVAAFLDGCYWHGCPRHYPERIGKRDGDALKTRVLENRGWLVVRVWECESTDAAVTRIVSALNQRRVA